VEDFFFKKENSQKKFKKIATLTDRSDDQMVWPADPIELYLQLPGFIALFRSTR